MPEYTDESYHQRIQKIADRNKAIYDKYKASYEYYTELCLGGRKNTPAVPPISIPADVTEEGLFDSLAQVQI